VTEPSDGTTLLLRVVDDLDRVLSAADVRVQRNVFDDRKSGNDAAKGAHAILLLCDSLIRQAWRNGMSPSKDGGSLLVHDTERACRVLRARRTIP
jgi:hypothetical protein